MEDVKATEEVDTMVTNPIMVVNKDAVHNTTEIGAEAVVVKATGILHITVRHTDCVPIQAKTSGPRQTDNI